MTDLATAVLFVYVVGVIFTVGFGAGDAISHARPDYTTVGLVAITWPVWLLVFLFNVTNA